MIYCYNCGKELEDDAKVCPTCGAKIVEEEAVEVVEATEKPKTKKAYTVLGKIGYILSIVSMCIWWIPFFGLLALDTGIVGIVFNVFGKKDPDLNEKCKKGFVLSIVATALAFVAYIIFVVVLEILAIQSAGGSY